VRKIETVNDAEWLRSRVSKDKSNMEIAKEAGCDICTVRRAAKRLGVTLNKQRPNRARTHTFDFRYFENVDTEVKAYMVGFIAADGYIGEWGIRIQLHERDVSILERFASELNYTGRVAKHDGGRLRMLSLYNVDTVRDMAQYGIVRAKTATLPFAKGIPDHLLGHYIRGVMDGDGSIGKQARLVTGSELFYNEFVAWFENTYDDKLWTAKEGNKYRLVFNKRNREFIHYLYKDSSIHLSRKYDKYKTHWC